jgi:phosphocarrier protein HPr
MHELDVTIQNKVGLHARPAAALIKTASGYLSRIFICKDGRSADAKSMLAILALGVVQGTPVTLRADGADEMEALEALKRLIDNNFGEPV